MCVGNAGRLVSLFRAFCWEYIFWELAHSGSPHSSTQYSNKITVKRVQRQTFRTSRRRFHPHNGRPTPHPPKTGSKPRLHRSDLRPIKIHLWLPTQPCGNNHLPDHLRSLRHYVCLPRDQEQDMVLQRRHVPGMLQRDTWICRQNAVVG